MTQLLFETERLLVRELLPQDLDALLAVYGDAEAMRWVGDGQPITREQCERWLDVTDNNYRQRGYGMAALIERNTASLVGFCGLVHPGGQADAEIKYALARRFWGQGLATEAVRGMLAYGQRRFSLHHVIATVAPQNEASQRVLGKAGLRPADVRRNDDGSSTQVFAWNPALS